MAGFFNKLKVTGNGASNATGNALPKNKKEEPVPDLTPLEKMLQNAGPPRGDGSDKFFGLENFGSTCYCNSIVQALYYSETFRENVVNYPPLPPSDTPDASYKKANITIRPPSAVNGTANGPNKGAQPAKQKPGFGGAQALPVPPAVRPEDKPDSPEYKKKQAMIKGPVLELARENTEAYGMQECTFTGLKDIFTAMIDSEARTGVLSPQRFLDIFKHDNEMFRNSMHQDAHEFYGLVLNDVIASVESSARKREESLALKGGDDPAQSDQNAAGASTAITRNQGDSAARLPGTGWVHDIFEGVLTSETKCLTCETTSQRDETFLDLSIDLEEHSSVTACLRKFSAEEMLCERNKFHCDHCGGLQEAEKRMKVKRLPKVLALHLKRFKYTEDYSRLQKLFHRVVYPYYLRMFNTTDDIEDPDRMYELYAVVVHIGGHAYHGHYVSVIKTQDRGWLLFDDEMVEPVDKHFVSNFFGDKPGTACAYVLFYKETTFEKMREEQEAEGLEEVKLASQKADLAQSTTGLANGVATSPLSKLHTQPILPADDHDSFAALSPVRTAPVLVPTNPVAHDEVPQMSESTSRPSVAPSLSTPASISKSDSPTLTRVKTKEEKQREKKEAKAQEKSRREAEKEQARLEAKRRMERQARLREVQKAEYEQIQKALQESKQSAAEEEKRRKREAAAEAEAANGSQSPGFLNRANKGGKLMARRSFALLGKTDKRDKTDKIDKSDKSERGDSSSAADTEQQNGSALPPLTPVDKPEKPLKERFSFSLGRRKTEKS